jgi:hypothetical protein
MCSTCQSPKKLEGDFSTRRESPDGLQNSCKACVIQNSKHWRAENGGAAATLADYGIGQINLRPGRWKLKACKYCGEEFNWTGMHVHLRSCEKHPRNRSRLPKNPNLPDMGNILKVYTAMPNTEKRKSSSLRYYYGIDIHEYNRLLAAQGGVCAICKLPPSGQRDSRSIHLAVDHSHTTGAVRALLCQHCNVGLGGFKDNPALLLAAIDYLMKFHDAHALSNPVPS